MRVREEQGSITPFVVIISLAILLLAALVVDGGRQLNAKGRAVAYAQEATRAGAQAIDVGDPRLDLVPGIALAAANEYCRTARAADPELAECRAEMRTINDPNGDYLAVAVSTTVTIKSILLGIINRHELTSSGEALARPVSGISDADGNKVPTIGPPSVAPPSVGTPTVTAPPTPPEIEVTPCTPKPTDDPDDDEDDEGGKDEDEDDEPADPEESKEPEECKTPAAP